MLDSTQPVVAEFASLTAAKCARGGIGGLIIVIFIIGILAYFFFTGQLK